MGQHKRFLLEVIWNIAPSKMSASPMAIASTPSTQYQHGLTATDNAQIHYVVGNEEICLETFVREIHVRDTQWWWKGKEEETAPFDGQPMTAALKSIPGFKISMFTILEVSDRVDAAQTTVKFSSWDIVPHTLCWTVIRTPA